MRATGYFWFVHEVALVKRCPKFVLLQGTVRTALEDSLFWLEITENDML